MNPVRAALWARLTGDATLTALLATPAAVYHRRAPQDAAHPFVVIDKQDGRPEWQFGADRVEWDLWLVKAVDLSGSASRAEEIAARIDMVLNDAPLVIKDRRLLYLRRDEDVDYPEEDGADLYQHVGGVYRLLTDPT